MWAEWTIGAGEWTISARDRIINVIVNNWCQRMDHQGQSEPLIGWTISTTMDHQCQRVDHQCNRVDHWCLSRSSVLQWTISAMCRDHQCKKRPFLEWTISDGMDHQCKNGQSVLKGPSVQEYTIYTLEWTISVREWTIITEWTTMLQYSCKTQSRTQLYIPRTTPSQRPMTETKEQASLLRLPNACQQKVQWAGITLQKRGRPDCEQWPPSVNDGSDIASQWLIWSRQQWPLWRGQQSLVSQEQLRCARDVFLKAIWDWTCRLRKAERLSFEIHFWGVV